LPAACTARPSRSSRSPALYPVVPVLLGLTVLRERINERRPRGLGLAGAAVGLIAMAG
jgi:hypothetical protein